MSYQSIVISSGHGLYVRGASGIIDEVDEARKVTEDLATALRGRGVDVVTYHDDVSKSQSENLNRITDFHNAQKPHELDISVHFNAYEQVEKPMGVEVLYVSQSTLAGQLSAAIAEAGEFINRGGKKRTDLHFLNACEAPAVLLETCFVDSETDCDLYDEHYSDIIDALADTLSGVDEETEIDTEEGEEDLEHIPPPATSVNTMVGTCSYFGGPDDEGVSYSEGLAFIYEIDEENQFLFLPINTGTGLARQLNPEVHYCAMRWDYDEHPKDTLLHKRVLVRNIKTGFALTCAPADWGPHEEKTGRLIDLSPSMMRDLGLVTDDLCEVTFPYEGDD